MSGSLCAVPPHLHLTCILSTPFRCNSNSFGGCEASLTSSAFEPITVCSPHFSHVQIGSGTPQYRWRDITQSRAPSSQSWNLLDPAHSGTHRTFWFSLSIFSLMEVTLTNHWSVARRMRAVLHLQQWGYECSMVSSFQRRFLAWRSSMITLFASLTNSPAYFPPSLVKRPDGSTGEKAGSPYFVPTSKSSSPCPGAVWTAPVPSDIETCSALSRTRCRSAPVTAWVSSWSGGRYCVPSSSRP